MKASLVFGLVGLGMIAFGILFVTTSGCMRADCGPSIQEISFVSGLALIALSLVWAVLLAVRGARRPN
jgi:hypothetical protein